MFNLPLRRLFFKPKVVSVSQTVFVPEIINQKLDLNQIWFAGSYICPGCNMSPIRYSELYAPKCRLGRCYFDPNFWPYLKLQNVCQELFPFTLLTFIAENPKYQIYSK